LENIEVIGVIELNDFMLNPQGIRDQLLKWRRDKFEPNQKIVFIWGEVEYFYHGHPTGFSTHNFLTVVKSCDISLSVFVFLVAYSNFKKSIAPFLTDSNDEPIIHEMLLLHPMYPYLLFDPEPSIGKNKDIIYPACSLLGTPRVHRNLFFKYLIKENLLDYVHVNYNVNSHPGDRSDIHTNTLEHPEVAHLNLIKTQAYTYWNESWAQYPKFNLFSQLDQIQIPLVTASDTLSIDNVAECISWNQQTDYQFLKHFAINIVCETQFDIPTQWTSEKTLRAIMFQMPFIIFGPQHVLKRLHGFGFKTFDRYWDESYDDIADAQERFIKTCELVKQVVTLPLDKLKLMYVDMLPILQYNQQCLSDYINNVYIPVHAKYGLKPTPLVYDDPN
jgi:hypothetical protein